MKKKLLLVLCTVLLVTTGCGKIPKLENGQEVIAELDGKSFSVDDLYAALKTQGGASALVNMIDSYIADKEIETTDEIREYADAEYEKAKQQYESYYQVNFVDVLAQNGFKDAAAYKEYIIANYKQDLIAKKYIKSTITDEEVSKYYDTNVYGEITARHILITPDSNDDMTDEQKTQAKESALAKAKELITKLDEGADFATLAKENSEDGSASEGGLLTPFTNESGLVDAFWVAARDMEVGKYSKTPVETEFGYHIILKEKVAEKPSLEKSKENIYDSLVELKIENDENLISKSLAEIRKQYNLNIIDTEIKDVYGSMISNLNKK